MRPVWSTETVQDSQGYKGKPCLEKPRERERKGGREEGRGEEERKKVDLRKNSVQN